MKESKVASSLSLTEAAGQWGAALVWPLMFTVPWLLSSPASPTSYREVFPASWYDETNVVEGSWPKPLGLCLGLLAVAVGQFWLCLLFYFFKYGHFGGVPVSVQSKGARDYQFPEGLTNHLAQPGGFGMLGAYLVFTWILGLMPESYYNLNGSIQWKQVLLCLVLQDGLQYCMHLGEHMISAEFYKVSHKPHHRFTNPRLFDAFDGSLADTFCMIIVPLATTNLVLVRTANVWTYMAFGSSYAAWLTLIHSEYVFPWDGLFRRLGLGTPGDHHVHHKFFKYNYGHLFMWFDQIAGTYRDPRAFSPAIFREGV